MRLRAVRTDAARAVHNPKHLLDTYRAGDWTDRAACAGMDVNAFFFDNADGTPGRRLGSGDDLERARAVCAGCPVTAQCLEFGQEHSRGYGVYGGLTGRERQDLRRSEARLPQQRRTYCRRCSTPYTLVNGRNECRVCRGRTDRLRADDKARQQREARARKAVGA